MLNFIAFAAIFGVGFFAGFSRGQQSGYNQAMQHVQDVINKLEKLYQKNINQLEELIRKRFIKQ